MSFRSRMILALLRRCARFFQKPGACRWSSILRCTSIDQVVTVSLLGKNCQIVGLENFGLRMPLFLVCGSSALLGLCCNNARSKRLSRDGGFGVRPGCCRIGGGRS